MDRGRSSAGATTERTDAMLGKKMESALNTLVDLARKESDHATDNMLQWFVAE